MYNDIIQKVASLMFPNINVQLCQAVVKSDI